jgi:hypothetical protein
MAAPPTPQDAQWAMDAAAHPADKEPLWNHPQEDDGWVHAHNALRGEIEGYGKALANTVARSDGKAPAAWEVAAMQQWWAGHAAHVLNHHKNEDDLFNPVMKERIRWPAKLETDHEGLVAHLDKLTGLTGALSTESAGCVSVLAAAFAAYKDDMLPHLLEEEQQGLPLMRAFFTPAEVGKVVQKILSNPAAPKEEMGSFIHFMGEEHFRNVFMPQEGIPFFVWFLDFKAKLQHYRTHIVSQLDALREGTAPPPPPKGGCTVS